MLKSNIMKSSSTSIARSGHNSTFSKLIKRFRITRPQYDYFVVNCLLCISVRPYKTAPETLRRFVAYIHDEGETTKVRSPCEPKSSSASPIILPPFTLSGFFAGMAYQPHNFKG